jgi:hypothetical protein
MCISDREKEREPHTRGEGGERVCVCACVREKVCVSVWEHKRKIVDTSLIDFLAVIENNKKLRKKITFDTQNLISNFKSKI